VNWLKSLDDQITLHASQYLDYIKRGLTGYDLWCEFLVAKTSCEANCSALNALEKSSEELHIFMSIPGWQETSMSSDS